MNRIFNFFSLIICFFCASNGLFACDVGPTKNQHVPYGLLRKEKRHNPLDPQNPYVAVLYLDRQSQCALIDQIEQLFAARMAQSGTVSRLGLNFTLGELSKQGQQKLFHYLDNNNYKLDKASRQVLVDSYRAIFNKYTIHEERMKFEQQVRLQEQMRSLYLEQSKNTNLWNAALKNIANPTHFDELAKCANWQNNSSKPSSNYAVSDRSFKNLDMDEDWVSLATDIEAARDI